MAFRDSINDLMFRFYEVFKKNNNRLPVSVDADINVGDIQIGTVKQGAKDAEAEPWDVNVVNDSPLEVQLKGQTVQIGGVTFEFDPPRTIYGLAASRPTASAAHAVVPFAVYVSVDTKAIEMTDATSWRRWGVF